MKIVDARLHPCTQPLRDPSWKFARATVPALEGHVLELVGEDGSRGLGYVHAIPAITTNGEGAAAAVRFLMPHLLQRDVEDLASMAEECDALLAGQPSAKAAVDMALHDLLARHLGVGLNVLLGGARRRAIPQARILAIKTPAAMAEQAALRVAEGFRQLKLKLSGEVDLDVQRVAAVRDAAGPGVVLTLDPNQSYAPKPMMRAFARMERHDIALIEQPVPAADLAGLALLTRSLPVAIEADESAQTVQDVFRLASEHMVDVMNLKITKLGGLRRFRQAVQVCEAAQIGCRVGAAFGPSLLQATAAHAASTLGRLDFGCELSENQHLLQDPFTGLADMVDGALPVPRGAGCGVDWAANNLPETST